MKKKIKRKQRNEKKDHVKQNEAHLCFMIVKVIFHVLETRRVGWSREGGKEGRRREVFIRPPSFHPKYLINSDICDPHY